MKSTKDLIVRYEPFGGIIATEHPPALTFVDKDFIKGLGFDVSSVWNKEWIGTYEAPIEAHYAITDFCNSNCSGCYMSSNDQSKHQLHLDFYPSAKKIANHLISKKIFHVALGGGESLAVPWIFDLAKYFKDNGVIPNLTTNGHYITDEIAKKCSIFGQVNVSLDHTVNDAVGVRPDDHFEKANEALKHLYNNNIRFGINCVVSKQNFDQLEEIVSYAKNMNVVDIELLRFKPTGRGKTVYQDYALDVDQAIELFPKLKKISKKYKVSIKLDCSFTPFICSHKPSKKVMEYFAIMGCDAGNWLIGVTPQGDVSPCSFIEGSFFESNSLENEWDKDKTFIDFRNWDKETKTKCSTCAYVSICKGGCHAVSHFLTGSFYEPDPECPLIIKGLV